MLQKSFHLIRSKSAMLAVAGALLGIAGAISPAMAQHTVAAQPPTITEQITVVAPYIVEEKAPVSTTNPKGVVYTVLEMSGNVSFADLDFTKAANGKVLETRINDTAKNLCSQLQKKYPETVYVPVKSADCAKSATDQAMIVALEIIAASAR